VKNRYSRKETISPAIVINIFTAVILFVIGFLLITGIITPYISTEFRVIFGIIFMSYGIFRSTTIYSKWKALKQEKKREEMKEAREKLLKHD